MRVEEAAGLRVQPFQLGGGEDEGSLSVEPSSKWISTGTEPWRARGS
ncbi:hypothetical protein [Streptomyces sp. NPDC048157]